VQIESSLLPSPHASMLLCTQKIYVTMFPCNECAKLLIQAGIKEVIFFEVRWPWLQNHCGA
jgi:deoxycytidylate deaminase